jgi:hypothetical protein
VKHGSFRLFPEFEAEKHSGREFDETIVVGAVCFYFESWIQKMGLWSDVDDSMPSTPSTGR